MSGFVVGSFVGPASASDVDEFLSNCKPSQNKLELSLGGWFWAHYKKESTDIEAIVGDHQDEFDTKGKELEQELLTECERIKKEEPVRAKKGQKSQKDCREEAYKKFKDGVEKLAKKCKIISGKWLLYPSPESVDGIWSTVVHSLCLADGALAKHPAVMTAKVMVGLSEGDRTHVMCVYVKDSWDKEAVKEVWKILSEEGLSVSAFKPDAYTHLNIDSKHASGIKSSLYTKTDLFTKDEIAAFDKARQEKYDAKSKAKEVKKVVGGAEAEKKKEEELKMDGGGFDADSDSEDEKPKKKKAKV
ncbi:translation Initiation factor eIF-4e-like domain protein [Pseudohyphozyma bogoriensis]|nr:translation Initiation factor eIF-4e-like domain protein [Pseudohyphozyma bogoriensis]